jgi:hypothetical protein
MKYVESNAGTMQGTYYNTEVAENDSRFMRGSKDQGSKLSISEVLARVELSYIICIVFLLLFSILGAQSRVCVFFGMDAIFVFHFSAWMPIFSSILGMGYLPFFGMDALPFLAWVAIFRRAIFRQSGRRAAIPHGNGER